MRSPDRAAELDRLGVRYIAPPALVQQPDLLCTAHHDDRGPRGIQIGVAGATWVNEVQNGCAEPVTLLAEEVYEGFPARRHRVLHNLPDALRGLGAVGAGRLPRSAELLRMDQDAIAISREPGRISHPRHAMASRPGEVMDRCLRPGAD